MLPPTAAACGQPLTLKEVLEVMGAVPEGKSPGPDRLPNKLYKTLAAELAPFLMEALNDGVRHGELHPTCLEGIISVMYKKKGPQRPTQLPPHHTS